MMRRKLLHRMKEVCGATSRIMDELIVGEHQVDGTRLLIYIYIYLYIDVVFFAILTSQVRCYCILYELYSNSRVLVYYIEGHFKKNFLCQ